MTAGRLLLAIALLSLGGAAVSSLSLYQHYGTDKSSYCDFGEKFNCDIVNRSSYSEVQGVPVALIGILGYLTLFGLATLRRDGTGTPLLLLIASFAGLSFALYLTYVEKFILAVWCILCLSSLGVIASVTILSSVLVLRERRTRSA
jgi:vitamin-K-epoxide reductase (warfarin-sensitive)